MDKNNIIRLTKKHTYLDADESYLNKIEKNLDELLAKGLLDDKDILIIAKFLFKKGKYQKTLDQINKLLENKQYSSSAYYGMYNCYLMLKNYENSYKCLLEYLKLKNNKKLNDGTAIIISAFEIILNDKYDYNINCTESFLMNRLIDDDLKIKYKELVEAYNSKKYKKYVEKKI